MSVAEEELPSQNYRENQRFLNRGKKIRLCSLCTYYLLQLASRQDNVDIESMCYATWKGSKTKTRTRAPLPADRGKTGG